MASDKRFDLYAVRKDSTVIGGITDQNVNTGIETAREISSGGVDSEFTAITAVRPAASFTSWHISSCLAALKNSGADARYGWKMEGNGLELFGYKHAQGSTREGNSSHKKLSILTGMVLPERLSWDEGSHAQISYRAVVAYDGATAPVVPSEGVTLPTAAADDERFGLPKLQLTSFASELDSMRSIELNFGIQESTEKSGGELYVRQFSISEILSSLRVRGINPDWFKTASAIPLLGGEQVHTTSILWLRKRKNRSTFHADGESVHVKIVLRGLAYITDAFNASRGSPGETELVVEMDKSSTTPPITISTGQAIS